MNAQMTNMKTNFINNADGGFEQSPQRTSPGPVPAKHEKQFDMSKAVDLRKAHFSFGQDNASALAYRSN